MNRERARAEEEAGMERKWCGQLRKREASVNTDTGASAWRSQRGMLGSREVVFFKMGEMEAF